MKHSLFGDGFSWFSDGLERDGLNRLEKMKWLVVMTLAALLTAIWLLSPPRIKIFLRVTSCDFALAQQ